MPIRATVAFVHGLGEHILRYNELFEAFAEKGIQTTSYDQRGYGRTGRKSREMGVFGPFSTMVSDVAFLLERARVQGVPMILASKGVFFGGGLTGTLTAIDLICRWAILWAAAWCYTMPRDMPNQLRSKVCWLQVCFGIECISIKLSPLLIAMISPMD